MLSKKILEQFNDRLNDEFYSAYLYLAMSAYFEAQNLSGFSSWMKTQAKEELTHAMKYYDHITDRNGRVQLQAVEAPKADWNSPLAAIEAAYKHEQKITKSIYGLVDAAKAEKDHATDVFLDWFVTEQVEEEEMVNKVLQKMKLLSDAQGGLFFIDRELAARA